VDGAFAALDTAGGEMFLDFSGVERIDPGAIRAMEKFTGAAKEKGVRVVLRGGAQSGNCNPEIPIAHHAGKRRHPRHPAAWFAE
jgi:hypothetical protein